ncbi:MAG: group I truncated hemoglobin [Steroidobacteraceae bacterium]
MLSGLRHAAALAAFAALALTIAGIGRAAEHESLYTRMGGRPVVTAFISDTIDRVVADPRTNPPFQGVNTRRIKQGLVQFVCQLADGGCKYTGDSLREAHANLHISEVQFDRMVEILRDEMQRHHVRLRERNQLLALLAPMKRDTVNVKIPPPPRTHPDAY